MAEKSESARSGSDGKQLEQLVSHIESQFLPQGLKVENRKRLFDEDGQIAELDIVISGKVGTTDFTWLIECRDRPSEGPAPRAWIQQLIGRQTDFKFNKITAVSTAGFAKSAVKLAKREGIDLREVAALKPEEFSSWMQMRSFQVSKRLSAVRDVHFKVAESQRELVAARLKREPVTNKTLLLRSIADGTTTSCDQAFLGVVNAAKAHDHAQPGTMRKILKIKAIYPNDENHFVIDTEGGPVRVEAIEFEGEIMGREP
jgi:hypothetical protein